MPKVSVIIPTHNRLDLLLRAIDSVRKQTFTDWELIVVDDGNSPSARSSLDYCINESWFTYLETKKNQGGAVARNLGVRYARGDCIAFLDDDDEWDAEKLKIQYEKLLLTADNVGYSYTSVSFGKQPGALVTKVKDGVVDDYARSLTNFKGALTSTLMVKRQTVENFKMFDDSFPSHQEPDLLIRLSSKYKALVIDKPLTYMCTQERGHIGGDLNKRIIGRELLLKKHEEKYSKFPKKYAKVKFQLGLWYKQEGDYLRAVSVIKEALLTYPKPVYCYNLFKLYIVKFIRDFR